MNKIIFYFFIIVFLTKTGNVFSSNNIFNVDNIIISKSNNENKEELLDSAFKEGFKKLIRKILLTKDLNSVKQTSLSDIKKLVSTYQIVENEDLMKEKKISVNLSFNREKINDFFYSKNISYADVSKINLVLFPVLIEDNNFYLFSDNYFYKNWILTNEFKEDEFINYVLPIENLEYFQLINQNKNNLESIPIKKILSNYDLNDYVFLVVTRFKEKIEVFLKGSISGNEIVKNFNIKNEKNDDKENQFKNTIKKTKQEINEIWKSQNLVDVRTPSFLNIVLNVEKKNDFLNLQKAFEKIDLIEDYYVLELNKKYVKIKIKYLGKIEKIRSKFKNEGIKVIISDNQWKLKLI
tara:strand:- start:3721 stop:4773 length:1053 start_codon:yes stop_codon:yes gene_type:complete